MTQPGQPPPTWFNKGLLEQTVTFETTVLRAMTFHGAMVLASKHPEIGAGAKAVIEDMLDHLEAMFESLGLERPEQGWRGMVDVS